MRSEWRYVNIDSDKDLAPNRLQAIIWANDDPVRWLIYIILPEQGKIHGYPK